MQRKNVKKHGGEERKKTGKKIDYSLQNPNYIVQ